MEAINKNYKIAQGFEYEGDDWWNWWIWIDGSDADLDNVDHVVYTLHPTFKKAVQKVDDRKSKFILKTAGWGTFTIYAKVVLKTKKEVSLEHELSLKYPDGTLNIE